MVELKVVVIFSQPLFGEGNAVRPDDVGASIGVFLRELGVYGCEASSFVGVSGGRNALVLLLEGLVPVGRDGGVAQTLEGACRGGV